MPIIQQLLLKVPSFVLGLMVIGSAVVFSILGLLIVRRFISHNQLRTHHDVADPILGALAAIYAVLIAFIVVTVWQGFDKSNANVQQEANYLADVYRDSEAFAPDFHQKVREVLREYRQAIVADEWKTMARGEMSPKVEKLMKKLWAFHIAYEPRTATERSFFDESVRKLNLLRELRRQRLMDSRTGIEPLLWFVLIAGGAQYACLHVLFRCGKSESSAGDGHFARHHDLPDPVHDHVIGLSFHREYFHLV